MSRPAQPTPRRRHGLRRLLVAVVVLLALLVVADRLALLAAERVAAGQLRTRAGLSSQPAVSIGGFPFLTQVLAGRYDQVEARANDVHRDGVTVAQTTVDLSGVSVSTGDALAGRLGSVPVDHAVVLARLSYANLNALVRSQAGAFGDLIAVSSSGSGRALISGPAGLSLHARAALSGSRLQIVPDASDLSALPSLIAGPVSAAFATPLTLPTLPSGMTWKTVSVDGSGVLLRATADHLVLKTG